MEKPNCAEEQYRLNKELAQMLGHYRPTITRQNYEPYLPHKVQKDEDMPNEATQSELQQAANILDNLLKF